LSPGASIT